MNVLIGCEMSGVVRRAFRRYGHDAWSCDLIPCLDKSPFHYQQDVLEVAKAGNFLGNGQPWELMIVHPTCRYLTRAGLRWITSPPRKLREGVLYGEERRQAMEAAIQFVLDLWSLPIEKQVIENPRGVLSVRWRPPDQVVQPWMFGHGEVKATAFWKRGLADLVPTNIVAGREARVHWESAGIRNGLTREQRRSITLEGMAEAYAEQWGLGEISNQTRKGRHTMTWFRRQDSRELTRKVTEKVEQWEREQLAERERRDRRARENETVRLARTQGEAVQAQGGAGSRRVEESDQSPSLPPPPTRPDRMTELAEAVGWTEGMAGELAGDLAGSGLVTDLTTADLTAGLGDDGPAAPTASQLARAEAEEERDRERIVEAAADREWLREMRVVW
jgi:hypothetical protein